MPPLPLSLLLAVEKKILQLHLVITSITPPATTVTFADSQKPNPTVAARGNCYGQLSLQLHPPLQLQLSLSFALDNQAYSCCFRHTPHAALTVTALDTALVTSVTPPL